MKSRWLFFALLLLTAGGALAMRLPGIDLRPIHHDEANQAVKTGMLLEDGLYRYDPGDHHGPTLYYLTLPILRLDNITTFAASEEVHYRIVPVVFGVGLVLLLLLVGTGLGRVAAVGAGLLTALSPAMVFYSRYYIQEMLLVFFTFAAIAGGWRYARTKRLPWLLLAGLSVGLMHATKETCIIAFGSMGLAWLVVTLWNRRWPARRLLLHLIPALAVAVAVSVLLFSSFFTHKDGPVDSIRTYQTYFERSGGGARGAHEHSWDYFLRILTYWQYGEGPVWSESLIVVLALAGFVGAFLPRGRSAGDRSLLRFLAVYTLAMTAVYSAIPYKTPWLMLSFLHGMILLAGFGAAEILRWARRPVLRAPAALVLLAALGHLGWQAHRANFVLYADPENPYVYAQTHRDVPIITRQMEQIAAHHRGKERLVIKVILDPSETWPFPWYLRSFKKDVGYYRSVDELPPFEEQGGDATMLIAAPKSNLHLVPLQWQSYHTEPFFLRPKLLLNLHVEKKLWKRYDAGRKK